VSAPLEDGTTEDVPSVDLGRGLDEARLTVPDTRRPLRDEVDPARSLVKLELDGARLGFGMICELGRDGAGEGGAGREEWSWELERGLVGMGW